MAECYEPLQRLRVGLWPCKIGLGPPVIGKIAAHSAYNMFY